MIALYFVVGAVAGVLSYRLLRGTEAVGAVVPLVVLLWPLLVASIFVSWVVFEARDILRQR